MTYATQAAKFGRIPTVFVEMDMDFCALRSGIGACTATETGDDKCYNTYSTCNDTANFDKTIKTYVFSEQNADLPIGLSTIPLLKSVNFASQEITPNKGLGVRGSVTAKFLDAPFPDTEIDPYWSERSYDTTNSGTFWGKFKARNPYYENRVLRVRRGYLTSVFDWGNFVDSVYVIDRLDGISKNDDVTVVAKDILKLADDKKALFPKPSNGRLSADISDTDTSFTLVPSGVGAEYKTSGKLAISGEVVVYSRSGDTFTVARGASNTTAEAHSADDTAQEVGIFDDEKIQDVIYELLTTYSGISTGYIDKDAWDDESTAYLAGVWNAEITEPTGINTLIGELTEQGLCRIWWDELEQQIRFRAVKPLPLDLPVLTDESHFLIKTIDAKTDTTQRIATVLIYFAQKKPTEKIDDLKNYELRVVTPDLDAISALQYGTNPFKKIYSRWFKKTSLGRVNALADSLIKTYRDAPRVIEFNLVPALQLKVGDLFIAETRKIQRVSGAIESVPFEVVFAQPTDNDDIKYKAQEVSVNIPISNRYDIPILDDEDVNLYDYFVNEFGVPDQGITVNFEILEDVFITGSTVSNYALTVDDRWPSGVTITLINKGLIAGRGGKGADACWYYQSLNSSPRIDEEIFSIGEDGEDGGNALLVDYPIIIDNTNGTIGGGAGGGGAGVSILLGDDLSSEYSGAGGGGAPIGHGGARGYIQQFLDGVEYYYTDSNFETAGTTATKTQGGDAGIKFCKSTPSPFGYTANGGKGGDLAQNGENGYSPLYPSSFTPGVGGIAGDAIHGNSFITWQNTGSILGTVT